MRKQRWGRAAATTKASRARLKAWQPIRVSFRGKDNLIPYCYDTRTGKYLYPYSKWVKKNPGSRFTNYMTTNAYSKLSSAQIKSANTIESKHK